LLKDFDKHAFIPYIKTLFTRARWNSIPSRVKWATAINGPVNLEPLQIEGEMGEAAAAKLLHFVELSLLT
jgi:hypothetical protein